MAQLGRRRGAWNGGLGAMLVWSVSPLGGEGDLVATYSEELRDRLLLHTRHVRDRREIQDSTCAAVHM
jgi:hypothetical protein